MALGKKKTTASNATKIVKPVVNTTPAKSASAPAVQKSVNNTPSTSKSITTPVVTGAVAGLAGANYGNTVRNTTPVTTGAAAGVANVANNSRSNTSTPVTTRPTNPTTTNNTATPTSNNVGVTPATLGLIGTTINPAGMIQTSIERQLAEQNQQTLDPHTNQMNANAVNTQMNARPNETPSETTQRYLNLMGSVTGNNSRPYSNPNFSYNNSVSRNNTGYNYGSSDLEDIIRESTYNSLVGEPGSNAPFTEVPQSNLNNANLALNGPTTVVANQRNTPTLEDLIAAQFARDYGTPETNNLITAAIEGAPFNPSVGQTIPAATSALTGAMAGVLGSGGGDTTNNNYVGGSGYGTRGGGVGGTPAYESAYDLDALYALLNAQLAEYDNQYNSLMANLLSAYNANNASLDDYYNQVLAALGNNYSDTENYLNGQLGNSQQALEDDRRRALQEAYIARMMQEKQLADQLDAYGLSGGASESVMANLRNNYMNNRAGVEERIQTSLRDLLQNYMGNISNARQSYNQALMNAEQNRLNARQGYANNLAEAQSNAASYLANARSGAYENLFNALARQYLG